MNSVRLRREDAGGVGWGGAVNTGMDACASTLGVSETFYGENCIQTQGFKAGLDICEFPEIPTEEARSTRHGCGSNYKGPRLAVPHHFIHT